MHILPRFILHRFIRKIYYKNYRLLKLISLRDYLSYITQIELMLCFIIDITNVIS